MLKQLVTVDLGASGGRVILGSYDGQKISLKEVHRFDGYHLVSGEHCEWDIDQIHHEICYGIDLIIDSGVIPDGIGIDTWGVDFVLTDADGNRLGKAVSYRDARTAGVMEETIDKLGEDFIYSATGVQFMPFNTIYQLKSLVDSDPEWLGDVSKLHFIPDYLGYLLTGKENCEYTFATTSQLLNCTTRSWDENLIDALELPQHWFMPVSKPNHIIGNYEVKGHSIPVISVASHDTAAAVAAVPMSTPDAAFISSGTWSVIGVEEPEALTSEAARVLNIANEGGVENFRVLKNVSGLWFLQKLREELGIASFSELVQLAEAAPAFQCFVDTNEARFLNPASMTDEIKAYCHETEQELPQTTGELARALFESLAVLYRIVINDLASLRQRPIPVIHMVGGGSQNLFLNQLCADACEIPVITGPVEASATGNLICQLIALGAVEDLSAGRRLISQSFPCTRFSPDPANQFDAYLARVRKILNNNKDLGSDQ